MGLVAPSVDVGAKVGGIVSVVVPIVSPMFVGATTANVASPGFVGGESCCKGAGLNDHATLP